MNDVVKRLRAMGDVLDMAAADRITELEELARVHHLVHDQDEAWNKQFQQEITELEDVQKRLTSDRIDIEGTGILVSEFVAIKWNELTAQLEAVKLLPDKWRDDELSAAGNLTNFRDVDDCIEELDKAIGKTSETPNELHTTAKSPGQ